ncbi:hypothetical protein SA3033_04545 [Aggregatibacter actinomycetemcomitans serotype d str. SA3033]|nr:hypothetical protein SA2149_09945 [Aggregatibacter actinomycetemcomitans serotype e str. SA2149]KYK73229.1 hypothetical protein SA2876_10670 [Aggregatibacter actinomycetemcomitans serotype e str. SA2876]KYK78620.1 hypothetical protein SC383S_08155 [Aggregatibacter actinomycetemcomitans SC383s]KYK84127.1 hypothetical protein SA3033_04545 [Aggregatibacter actinomycetemcomitans serotype d str. SA3033]KYK87708.1 hypothetical protein SA2200_05410 [Aggregatibacter actinomycetemcomitans serotype d 
MATFFLLLAQKKEGKEKGTPDKPLFPFFKNFS